MTTKLKIWIWSLPVTAVGLLAYHAGVENPAVAIVALVAFVISSAGSYFLPTLIAEQREHEQLTAIALLNFFGGWLVIGWIVALVWAAIEKRKPRFSVNTMPIPGERPPPPPRTAPREVRPISDEPPPGPPPLPVEEEERVHYERTREGAAPVITYDEPSSGGGVGLIGWLGWALALVFAFVAWDGRRDSIEAAPEPAAAAAPERERVQVEDDTSRGDLLAIISELEAELDMANARALEYEEGLQRAVDQLNQQGQQLAAAQLVQQYRSAPPPPPRSRTSSPEPDGLGVAYDPYAAYNNGRVTGHGTVKNIGRGYLVGSVRVLLFADGSLVDEQSIPLEMEAGRREDYEFEFGGCRAGVLYRVEADWEDD